MKTHKTKGDILYADHETHYKAEGVYLRQSLDGGLTWTSRARLPRFCTKNITCISKKTRRLFRSGFHHLAQAECGSLYAIAHKSLYKLDPKSSTFKKLSTIPGSRPLWLESGDGKIVFGEYRSNPERSPVGIFTADKKKNRLKKVLEFDNVRHIHGVFYDPYTSSFWITTGDRNSESYIWQADRSFRNLSVIRGGDQLYRVIKPVFTRDRIFFGTDRQDQHNTIWSLDRKTYKERHHCEVRGPIFYGASVKGMVYFTTASEPSEKNYSGSAEIWAQNEYHKWIMIDRHEKDLLPHNLFQFGHLKIPNGPGDNEKFWVSPMALRGEGWSYAYSPPEHKDKTLNKPVT